MSKDIKTIFQAKFTCVHHNGRIDAKSRMEYFTESQDRASFWHWVNMYLEKFKMEYETVIVDSINMI